MRPRRPRLDPSLYIGLQRYFLTFCTAQRRRWFVHAGIVQRVLEQILQSAELFDMAVIAYCFMPDHVHLLVEGCSDGADAIAFVHHAKQRAGYAFARTRNDRLWQPSYHDRILRHDEATIAVARYIVENPVRGGLVVAPADYPFSGSTRFTMEQLLDAVRWQP